jgi:cellulose synthase/poly-beta-1,6-N-acetylglucosamine synthase-like glycosyltransferase
MIIISVLFISYSVIILWANSRFRQLKPFHAIRNMHEGVTIVVAARNESAYIQQCIESVLAQEYPVEKLELIVVDDQSTDDTAQLVLRYKDRGVKLISIKAEEQSGKKAAIAIGIELASHDLIITTDADCLHPRQWINTMVAFREKSKAVFVAGPVKFNGEQNFFERFQSLDFLSLQGITAVAVSKELINMCNGANLLYTKQAFKQVNGFAGIDHIPSGDDMLLMEKISNTFPGGVAYCYSAEAIVTPSPEKSLSSFIQQRIRWASKSIAYKGFAIKAVLLLVYLINLIVAGFFIMGLVDTGWMKNFAVLILIKYLVELPFMINVCRFFKKASLIKWFIISQPVHALYTIVAGLFGLRGNYEWKGRNTRLKS